MDCVNDFGDFADFFSLTINRVASKDFPVLRISLTINRIASKDSATSRISLMINRFTSTILPFSIISLTISGVALLIASGRRRFNVRRFSRHLPSFDSSRQWDTS